MRVNKDMSQSEALGMIGEGILVIINILFEMAVQMNLSDLSKQYIRGIVVEWQDRHFK